MLIYSPENSVVYKTQQKYRYHRFFRTQCSLIRGARAADRAGARTRGRRRARRPFILIYIASLIDRGRDAIDDVAPPRYIAPLHYLLLVSRSQLARLVKQFSLNENGCIHVHACVVCSQNTERDELS